MYHPMLEAAGMTAAEYRNLLLQVADTAGLPLLAADDESVSLAYLPPDLDWPEVHIDLMFVNFRIQQLDGPYSAWAFWCYPGTGLDAFIDTVARVKAWGGDPGGEPTGYIKRHVPDRAWRCYYQRKPGRILTPADFAPPARTLRP